MNKRAAFGAAAVAAGFWLMAGCATRPAPAPAAAKPGTVMTYTAPTREEGRAQAELERADQRARKQLEKAEEELQAAVGAAMAASQAFEATDAPADAPRPTREEVDRLTLAANEKWRAYQDGIAQQVDRYESFLKRFPANWQARHRYAWFLADMHLEEEAGAEWRKVIEIEPRFPFAYNNLGTIYNHNGRDLEAVILFRKAIELYDVDHTFHCNLAVNYSTHRYEVMKEFDWDLPRVFHECIAEYARARQIARDQGDAEMEKQYAYDLAGQYVLAKFFQLGDTSDEALTAWSYYLGLKLTDHERGIAMRNVGTLYWRQKKDAATAMQWLEKAAALMPDDPTTRTLIDQIHNATPATVETQS